MSNKTIHEMSCDNMEYMTKIRRKLHSMPGTGFDNSETIEYIKEKLLGIGLDVRNVGKCGLSALIGNGSPCILLRADTDGLRLKEESGLSFASKNGNMHACGHDIHTAQLLGAAKILSGLLPDSGGCIKLMFQSAEEILEGAADMIDGGILNTPCPDAAVMIHVMTATELPTGTVIVSAGGEAAPSADFFRITVRGKGCHGSSPSEGKDPVYAACMTVCALSEITSRELAISERAVITIGAFNAGTSANVIPDTAVLEGTLRCFGNNVREYVKSRITEIVKDTARVFGSDANTEFTSGCPSLYNNEKVCDIVFDSAVRELGSENVINGKRFANTSVKASGSEDFSYISRRIPSTMLALAAGNAKDGHIYPLHHPRVTFDERAMASGCTALVSAALGLLNAPHGDFCHADIKLADSGVLI